MTSYDEDIKPLFRIEDRAAMEYLFDLWSYTDVQKEAVGILERLEDGTMPCDVTWDALKVGLFREWIAEGCSP
jgi:hypothetical protein